MRDWKNISGTEIIDSCIEDDKIRPRESEVEDAYKQNWMLASDGELKLLKLYYTDGFGWYYNKNTHKVIFVLHECKVLGAESKFNEVKYGTYQESLKKALLQVIGYYNKIKNKSYSSFSKDLKKLAQEFEYSDVNQFIIDNFGLFLITCPNFVAHVKFTDVKELVEQLEEPMNKSEITPSKYWSKDPTLKNIMEKWNINDLGFIATDKYNTTDTQRVLNELMYE